MEGDRCARLQLPQPKDGRIVGCGCRRVAGNCIDGWCGACEYAGKRLERDLVVFFDGGCADNVHARGGGQ